MLQFIAAFAVSAAFTLFVVRVLRNRGQLTKDHVLSGPQKVHVQPVARIGGAGIFAALLAMGLLATIASWEPGLATYLLMLLACGLPAFAAGLAEDLTKKVPPLPRLLAAAISALLAVQLLGTAIRRTDIWGLDALVAFEIGAALLAMIAVAGMANAVNIIDGFNGLASMCVVMILLAVAYVAGETGDRLVQMLALIGAGATLGFFLWNYPHGLIFLGDGGAYFLGFYAAEVALLLLLRNPSVSPLFPLLAAVYPVFETVFTVYRRRIVRGRAIDMPDGVHLHSLIYRRVLRWAVGKPDAAAMTRRNAMTAPYLWMLCMMAVVPSVLFWDNSRILGIFIVLFGLIYVSLYSLIIRFKSPRWLHLKRGGPTRR